MGVIAQKCIFLLLFVSESCFVVARCMEYLLRNDADPGVRDKQGYSAVHYASAYGRTLCLELVGPVNTENENVFPEKPSNHASLIWSFHVLKCFKIVAKAHFHNMSCYHK